MDFVEIKERSVKKGVIEIYPDFNNIPSKDLMIRGGKFYAIWNEDLGVWSKDEYDVQRLVDNEIRARAKQIEATTLDKIHPLYLKNNSNKKSDSNSSSIKFLDESKNSENINNTSF